MVVTMLDNNTDAVGWFLETCSLASAPAILLPPSAADGFGTTAATFLSTVTFSPTAFTFQFYL